MSFTWPALLWLLLLLPLTAALLGLAERRRRRTAQAFADAHLLPHLLSRPSRRQERLLLGLQLAALGLLLLAAARPVASPPLPVNKAAVVIAIDASRSMLANDVEPSRLERALALAESFIDGAPAGARIGLVSFSDIASVLMPPTTDRDELREALARIAPARNTSLAAAVVTGVRMLPGREALTPPEELTSPGALLPPDPDIETPVGPPPPGSMIIFSDGVSNVSANPELPAELALDLAARFAADAEVKLYTVPVGREGGTVTRIEGRDYFIPFEPRNLERLAERSAGRYVADPDSEALGDVFRELGTVIRWEATEMEISALLSGVAVLLLLLAGAIGMRWHRRVP